jgi:hypothetical protein
MRARSGGVDPGRDGCRVPLPWSGERPPFGFSAEGTAAAPWLSQPAHWADLTVDAQLADPCSMLHLYRAMLRIRRHEPGLGEVQPLSVRLPTLEPTTDLGVFIAALTISSAIPIALFLLFQRLFLRGPGLSGAIKG